MSEEASYSIDSLLNKWCWEDWTDTCRKMKLDHLLMTQTKINSKWIKDLNIRPKNIKILEYNIGSNISDTAHSSIFLMYLLRQGRQKKKINKWDYLELKRLCTAKETINKIKRQLTEWDNIFADTSDKRLIWNIYKEFTKLSTKKAQTTPLQNGPE